MNPQSIKLALILNNSTVAAKEATQGGKSPGPNRGLFSALLGQAMKTGKVQHGSVVRNGRNSEETQPGWLEHFRNRLMLLGTPVKELSLSRKALPYLKKILVGQGYSGAAVTGFLNRLFQGEPCHEIKLVEFFEKLSDLYALFKKKSAGPFLETSAIPHLEAALCRLGLEQTEAKRVIEQAKGQEGQVNLQKLTQGLKGIMRELPGAKLLQADGKAAGEIHQMLARAGITDEGNTAEAISLDRFIGMLEEKVAALAPQSQTKAEVESHVDGLVRNVLAPNKEQYGKSKEESFYAHKLKSLPNEKANSGRETGGKWKASAVSGNKKEQGPDNAGFKEKATKLLAQVEKLAETPNKKGVKEVVDQDKTAIPHSSKESLIDNVSTRGTTARTTARPVVPTYVVNQVSRQIAFSLGRGENHIRLQLKPPHLGSIQIDMNIQDSVLKVEMITEHNSAKEILMSNIQELRDSLAQQGVKVDQVDVQVSHNSNQSMAQFRRGQYGFSRRWRGKQGGFDGLDHDTDLDQATPMRMIRTDALLDLVA